MLNLSQNWIFSKHIFKWHQNWWLMLSTTCHQYYCSEIQCNRDYEKTAFREAIKIIRNVVYCGIESKWFKFNKINHYINLTGISHYILKWFNPSRFPNRQFPRIGTSPRVTPPHSLLFRGGGRYGIWGWWGMKDKITTLPRIGTAIPLG